MNETAEFQQKKQYLDVQYNHNELKQKRKEILKDKEIKKKNQIIYSDQKNFYRTIDEGFFKQLTHQEQQNHLQSDVNLIRNKTNSIYEVEQKDDFVQNLKIDLYQALGEKNQKLAYQTIELIENLKNSLNSKSFIVNSVNQEKSNKSECQTSYQNQIKTLNSENFDENKGSQTKQEPKSSNKLPLFNQNKPNQIQEFIKQQMKQKSEELDNNIFQITPSKLGNQHLIKGILMTYPLVQLQTEIKKFTEHKDIHQFFKNMLYKNNDDKDDSNNNQILNKQESQNLLKLQQTHQNNFQQTVNNNNNTKNNSQQLSDLQNQSECSDFTTNGELQDEVQDIFFTDLKEVKRYYLQKNNEQVEKLLLKNQFSNQLRNFCEQDWVIQHLEYDVLDMIQKIYNPKSLMERRQQLQQNYSEKIKEKYRKINESENELNQKYLSRIQNLEKLIDNYQAKEINLTNKIENQQKQINKLNQIIDEDREKKEVEILKIMELCKDNESIKQSPFISKLESYDNLINVTQKEQKRKIRELDKKIKDQDEHIQTLNKKIVELKQDLENSLKRPFKKDKTTQIDLIVFSNKLKNSPLFPSYLDKNGEVDNKKNKCFLLSMKKGLEIINVFLKEFIINEKNQSLLETNFEKYISEQRLQQVHLQKQQYEEEQKNDDIQKYTEEAFSKFYYSQAFNYKDGNEEQKIKVLTPFLQFIFTEISEPNFYLQSYFETILQNIIFKPVNQGQKTGKNFKQTMGQQVEKINQFLQTQSSGYVTNFNDEQVEFVKNSEISHDHIIMKTFDTYNCFRLLEECHNNLKELLRQEVKSNERIKNQNDDFLNNLSKILQQQGGFSDSELQIQIDHCQKTFTSFRMLLEYLSQKFNNR
ncbi:hypothetical protein PPERSA_06027 [Pseudocohnilembus persalinus]|uniref:Uncharacterized protein n=1 Tax=Pseudocohnilembus persalinus TaxID=266149 RepID=A0A0V0QR11_PSEPJ|nr:hypothetical protein PPERSA_06027 [Pseudocohnilembus persalinus]|eukprot:KRX04474.1 hypothetical protein PPERSA_06027 [Pseudocohnilembus persalinus]